MNKYEVIHLVDNMDNMDEIEKILGRWELQTSVISPEVKEGAKQCAIDLAKLGETKLYNHIKTMYGLKM